MPTTTTKPRKSRLRQRAQPARENDDNRDITFSLNPQEAMQILRVLNNEDKWENLHDWDTMVVRQILRDLATEWTDHHIPLTDSQLSNS
jgi:hypothetical protein